MTISSLSKLWIEKRLEWAGNDSHYHKVLRMNAEQVSWFAMLDEPLSAEDFEALPTSYFEVLFSDVLMAGPDSNQVFNYLKLLKEVATEESPSIQASRVATMVERQDASVRYEIESLLDIYAPYLFNALTLVPESYFPASGNGSLYSPSNNWPGQQWLDQRWSAIKLDVLIIGGQRFFPEQSLAASAVQVRLEELASAMRSDAQVIAAHAG